MFSFKQQVESVTNFGQVYHHSAGREIYASVAKMHAREKMIRAQVEAAATEVAAKEELISIQKKRQPKQTRHRNIEFILIFLFSCTDNHIVAQN